MSFGFKVEGYVLREALTRVKPAVCKRGWGLPSSVQFGSDGDGKVRVRATDAELTVETTVDAGNVSGGNGWFPVDHAALLATLKGLTKAKHRKNPTMVTVQVAGDGAEVKVGALTHSVPVFPVDEVPVVDPVVDGERVVLSPEVWRMVLPYAGTDDARPILTGINLQHGDIAATDSYRLVAGSVGIPENVNALVPGRMAKTFLKSKENIELTVGAYVDRPAYRDDEPPKRVATRATARFEDMTVTARLIEGEFPNYRQLIPDSSPSSVTIAKADYDAFLGVLPKKSPAPFRIDRDDNKAVLSHTIPDGPTAEAIVEAEWDAPESVERKPGFPGGRTETVWSGTLAFNGAYFKDLIAEQGDLVKLEFTDALKPAVVSWMHEGALFNGLIMPVRVA